MRTVRGKSVYESLDELLAPEHTALVLLNPERSLPVQDGTLPEVVPSRQSSEKVLPVLASLLNEARKRRILTVFLRTSGAGRREFLEGISPDVGEIVVLKPRASAFIHTELDFVLASRGIHTVVLAGFTTAEDVASTAGDALNLDYHAVVARDGIADSDDDLHEQALAVLAARYTVVAADVVKSTWAAASSDRSLPVGKPAPLPGTPDLGAGEGLAARTAPNRTALLVIDMQNDLCSPSGFTAKHGADISSVQAIIPRIQPLVQIARERAILTVYLQLNTERSGLTDSPALLHFRTNRTFLRVPPEFLISNTWGCEISPELTPLEGDLVIPKNRPDGFIGTNLDLVLRSNGIRTIVLTGCATHGCVEATGRGGASRNYDVVVVGDCVSSREPDLHAASLHVMERLFEVVESSTLTRYWSAANPQSLSARGS